MTLIHAHNYYPPRSIEDPSVRVEIEFNPEDVDRKPAIPRWPFNFQVTTTDFRGVARAGGGTVEALTEEHAKLRVYVEVLDVLAEMLAERIPRSGVK